MDDMTLSQRTLGPVELATKVGEGVGAEADVIWSRRMPRERIGTLVFSNRRDWQVKSLRRGVPPEVFDLALVMAKGSYPDG